MNLINPYRFSVGGDPHFANVSLLMHFEGADGATDTWLDSSGHFTFSNSKPPTLQTDHAAFGVSSGYFPGGTSDWIDTTGIDITPLNFGSGDFTIEFWVRRLADTASTRMLISTRSASGADNGFSVYLFTGFQLCFIAWNASTALVNFVGGVLPQDTWAACAVTREGSTFRIFVDGVLTASASSATAIGNSTRLYIGTDPAVSGRVAKMYIDELRITKGVARYTADYTVATAAFPNN